MTPNDGSQSARPREAPRESPFKGRTGFRRLWNATRYSIAGFRAAYACEDAFRQEVRLAILLIAVACALPVGMIGRALMIGSVLLVLIVELLSSAVVAAVDRISLDRHRLSKRAKDVGSAGVFAALANVLVIWTCVLLA